MCDDLYGKVLLVVFSKSKHSFLAKTNARLKLMQPVDAACLLSAKHGEHSETLGRFLARSRAKKSSAHEVF